MIQVINRSELRNLLPNAEASYRFEGQDYGGIPLSFFWTDAPAGTGPALHQHLYAEIFVVQEGDVTFTVGGETIETADGQIVIAPAGLPHRFENAGPGRSRHVDIHPISRVNGPTFGLAEELTTPLVIRREDLPHEATSARFEGWRFGGVPVSFFWTDAPPGTGPALHRHPYTEVFLMQEGRVRFTVGEDSLEATAGRIVIAPAGQPHTFVNVGPGRARHLDIHTSSRIVTEWLDGSPEVKRNVFATGSAS